MSSSKCRALLVIQYTETVEDWSLIEDYVSKISEAIVLIAQAEAQLGEKFAVILTSIKKLDDELERLAREGVKADGECEAPDAVNLPEHDVREYDSDDALQEVSLKKLFGKIAKLTHPDAGDNEALFIKAKKALKNGNRALLYQILEEAEASYDLLFGMKLQEYTSIVESVAYVVATDWFSGNLSRQTRAETYYLSGLLQTLQIKQTQLNSKL
jgi:hypothetical protein